MSAFYSLTVVVLLLQVDQLVDDVLLGALKQIQLAHRRRRRTLRAAAKQALRLHHHALERTHS